MKHLVRLGMRPSRDRKSFRYMLDRADRDGKRRQISLGHADKRRAKRQRHEKELELRANVAEPISMRLTEFIRDSLTRTKGQVRASTLDEDGGQLDRHPRRRLKPPKTPKREIRVFNEVECCRLSEAASKASREGQFVARLLRASAESDKNGELPCVSAACAGH